MKNNKKIILGSISAFTLFLAFTVVGVFGLADSVTAADTTAVTSSGGIVPCGTDATGPCTLCHLIIGIQRLFQYGLYLVTTLAFVGIFIGGAMYMISAGDSGIMESAKKFIGASLIGFAIVLGAWLIVNIILNVLPIRSDLWKSLQKTNWYTFSCKTESTTLKNPTPTPTTPTASDDSMKTTETCGYQNKGTCWRLGQSFCDAGWVNWLDGTADGEGRSGRNTCKTANSICCATIMTKTSCSYGGANGICVRMQPKNVKAETAADACARVSKKYITGSYNSGIAGACPVGQACCKDK